MATPIAMPKQGQSVESCIIQEWMKKKGDSVKEGDVLFSYETDKASFEFTSPASGTLLEIFANAGDDVPVHTVVGAIGNPGEDASGIKAEASGQKSEASGQLAAAKRFGAAGRPEASQQKSEVGSQRSEISRQGTEAEKAKTDTAGEFRISPRARVLAERSGIDISAANPSGPNGRIIERDIKAALEAAPRMTKTAQAKVAASGLAAPAAGSGIGGRIRADDLVKAPAQATATAASMGIEDAVTEVKLSGMRKIIADRMFQSLQQAAQLTMNTSARADGLLAYRAMVKKNAESLGLANITVTDLVAFAVARTLPKFPEINALYADGTVRRYAHAHLAVAVDTPRGLMVPVVRFADCLSLNELAKAIKSLTQQCLDGAINPDLLNGGTFTLSNLGTFGIESFTPVLNAPQVALLGVNTISPKPVAKNDGSYEIVPHIGLSLTIDHRAVDGAPGARFAKAVVQAIENISMILAI